MLVLNPRRAIYRSQGKLASFASLRRFFLWPEGVTKELQAFLRGKPLATGLRSILLEKGILVEPDPELEVFELREIRPNGWANSNLGIEFLELSSGPLTVLDALNFNDINALPRDGGLLYIGPHPFYVAETSTADGLMPCPRCLMLRFLAASRAAAELYWALREGARVAFPVERETLLGRGLPVDKGVCFLTGEHNRVDSVLPLPDCQYCLARSSVSIFNPGPFAPICQLVSADSCHSARLPEMLWLAGQDTVGGGSSYDKDYERGRERALNEALERYSAHFVPASATKEGVLFKSDKETKRFSLSRALLVEPGSVSTGLACRDNLEEAVADGLKEAIERDALARFWLELLSGQAHYRFMDFDKDSFFAPDGFEVVFLQLQSFQEPVVLCLFRDSYKRQLTGSACGLVDRAAAKAFSECMQNFSYFSSLKGATATNPSCPQSFFEHALSYWAGQNVMPALKAGGSAALELKELSTLVYHADITPPDLTLTGKFSVRVLVPGLIYLPMHHQDWQSVLASCGSTEFRPPKQPHPFA